MPVISANGIEIAYDDRGSQADPAILLIMGLATQMIAWPEAFCDDLAVRGFRVVRFDNRDVGLSTKFDAAPPIDLGAVLQRVMAGEKINPPYDLTDMAADAVGLMDRLAIKKAHIVGASMGGMIAQVVAAKYPDRVRSLVSIMSSSGEPGLPQAMPEAMTAIMQARPDGSDRELAVQHGMRIYRAIGSPGFPTPDDELRMKVGAAFDRSSIRLVSAASSPRSWRTALVLTCSRSFRFQHSSFTALTTRWCPSKPEDILPRRFQGRPSLSFPEWATTSQRVLFRFSLKP